MAKPPRARDLLQKSRRLKGIRMRKSGKWVSEVRIPNSKERLWLGTLDTPEQAGRAYDAAAYCLRGPQAKLNFPDTPPEIPSASSLSGTQIKSEAARIASRWRSASLPLPQSDSSTIDGVQHKISNDGEASAFWKFLLAYSHNVDCSNFGHFPSVDLCACHLEAQDEDADADDWWSLS